MGRVGKNHTLIEVAVLQHVFRPRYDTAAPNGTAASADNTVKMMNPV